MTEKDFQTLIGKMQNLFQPFDKMNKDQVQIYNAMWRHERYETVDKAITFCFIQDTEYKAKRIIPPPGIIQRFVQDVKDSGRNDFLEPVSDVPLPKRKYQLYFSRCMMGLFSAMRKMSKPDQVLTYRFVNDRGDRYSFVDLFVKCYNEFGFAVMDRESYLRECGMIVPELPTYLIGKLVEPKIETTETIEEDVLDQSVPF